MKKVPSRDKEEDDDMDSFFEGLGIGRVGTPPISTPPIRPDAAQHRSPKNVLRSVDAKKRHPVATVSQSATATTATQSGDAFLSWLDGKEDSSSASAASSAVNSGTSASTSVSLGPSTLPSASAVRRVTSNGNVPTVKGAPPAFQGPLTLAELPAISSNSDRARAWEEALNLAEEDEEEDLDGDTATVVSSVFDDDETLARRAMAAMRKQWGDLPRKLSGAPTKRMQAMVRSLLAFQDPKLFLHLQQQPQQNLLESPLLFSFLTGPQPCMPLWDAAVLGGVEGFDSVYQGRVFFAVGILIFARADLLAAADLEVALSEACKQAAKAPRAAMAVGSRASNHLPPLFVKVTTESEIDWEPYMTLVNQLPRAPRRAAPPPGPAKVVVVAGATKKPVAGSFPRPPPESTQAAVASWWGGAQATASVWGAKLAEATAQASQQLSKTLLEVAEVAKNDLAPLTTSGSSFAGANEPPGSPGEGSSSPAAPGAERKGSMDAPAERKLYLCKYAGKRRLGLQLIQSRQGLQVSGFDRGDQLMPGEAEEEGTVQIGDVVHAVNGASVVLLPPSIAGRVIAKQERPLHVTFSTTSPPPASRLTPELVRMQRHLLSSRLASFYAVHGPGKVDKVNDILDLYACHEPALLRGLAFKYGEHVPGDDCFQPEVCLISACDIVNVLVRKRQDDDDVFVDCRSLEDRVETGWFPTSFRVGNVGSEEGWADIVKALKTRTGLTRYVRVCVIASGRDHIYALADPARSEDYAREEYARVREVITKLSELGICFVCGVKGGFAACLRECTMNHISTGIEGGVGGTYQRACEAYATLDFENTTSVARFLDQHVKNFEPPRDDDPLDALNVAPTLNKLAGAIAPLSAQLPPLQLPGGVAGAKPFSLAALGFSRSSSGGVASGAASATPSPPQGVNAPTLETAKTGGASAGPTSPGLAPLVSPRAAAMKSQYSGGFSIDDDLM